MTGLKISKTLLVVMLTPAIATGSTCAENATMDKTQSGVESAGQKVDNSMNRVDDLMDDSTVAAEVRTTLVNHESIKNIDISVKTDQKAVTLSGFVENQTQTKEAVKVAGGVGGVTSVSDKLHVRDSKGTSVEGYADDTAITSEVRARLLANDIVPSRKMKVEVTGGVVQLSDTVDSQAQNGRAKSIAKTIGGVESVKNDLKTQ